MRPFPEPATSLPSRTPLHCAASCNDTAICIALVKHGAAIFASTFSDGSLAIEKCDPYREGYNECFSYLAGGGKKVGWLWEALPSRQESPGGPSVLLRDSHAKQDPLSGFP